MAKDHDPDRPSPPCFAHELALTDEGYVTFDPAAARDAARWRKGERRRLIAARLAIPADEWAGLVVELGEALDRLIAFRPGLIVGVYWPVGREPDLAEWIATARERGARIGLPAADMPDGVPTFREWVPGGRLVEGPWRIPVPADGAVLVPDVVIAPIVGFDRQCHCLGRGDAYYDRLLAASTPRPMSIAVAAPSLQVETIFPQPHDIPMDFIITGRDRILERPKRDG